MLRRSFLTGIVAACCVAAVVKQVIEWKVIMKPFHQELLAHCGDTWCSFCVDGRHFRNYSIEETWAYFAYPACLAIQRELGLNESVVFGSKALFLKAYNGI